jgi:hypothetical protein
MGFVFCLPIDLVFLSSVASCLQSESLDPSSPRCPSHPHRPALMRARSARPPFRSAAGSFQLDHECDSRRGRNDANRNVAICKLAQHTNDSDKAFR